MPKERDILKIIFRNFIDSLKPRRFSGDLVGKDHMGTEYFEVPPRPGSAKRTPARYFNPKVKDDFQQELPAEWEAWLRYRRKLPPTEEEVLKNLAIAEMKKKSAMEAESKRKPKDPKELQVERKGRESFPIYDEYEVTPGIAKKDKSNL